jgi:CheY-like chemotaxis protein
MRMSSYQKAYNYFIKKEILLPPQEDLGYDFVGQLQSILQTPEPSDKMSRPARKKDRVHTALVLGQILNNERSHRVKEMELDGIELLPDLVKKQRKHDIAILSLTSSDDELKKRSFFRFESALAEYLPHKYKQILETYANASTKRLSLQQITNELQVEAKASSLLRTEVLSVL